MTTAEEQIAALTKIIKDNRLHEAHCPAFSTSKGGDFTSMFQGMAEKSCHCWLDKGNTSEPGTGFGYYNQATKLIENVAYRNRHDAYNNLIDHQGYSEDKEDAKYWWKHYMIVPITYKES